MKNKLKPLLAAILGLCLIFALAACGGDKDPVGGKTPTQSDWSAAGITGGFAVEVKGTLVTNQAVEGEIQMKWTGSDETSLDNTIIWLKGQGYSSYGGASAEKTSGENGKMLSYIAEKTVNAATAQAASVRAVAFAATAAESGSKTMIAETYYITGDFSIMGNAFKAGELYLALYPEEEPEIPDIPGGPTNEWPAASLQTALGTTIPAYTGTASGYTAQSYNVGANTGVSVMIYGAQESEFSAWQETLRSGGFSVNADYNGLIRTDGNGNTVVIAGFSFVPGAGIASFHAYVVKNRGQYDSWPGNQLTAYYSAGIPVYSGGTSFDCTEFSDEMYGDLKQAQEQIVQAYNLALQYGQVTPELTAQYEEAQRIIREVGYIESTRITVYGTTEAEKSAYVTAILASPGERDEQNFTESGTDEYSRRYFYVRDYEITITLGEVADGKLTIDLLRVPVSLLGEQGGDEPSPASPYTMPENLKVEYTFSNSLQYTMIKIGDDYYVENGSAGFTEAAYYKKNGSGWDVYTREMMSADWIKEADQETDREYLEREIFGFIVTYADVSDMTQNGTATVAGRTAKVYSYGSDLYNENIYKDAQTGLVLKVESIANGTTTVTYVVTNFDTSVTSFGNIVLPQ